MKKIMLKVLVIFVVIIALAGIYFLAKSFFIKEELDNFEGWNETRGVNEPEILTGMTPVYFPVEDEVITDATQEMIENANWYDYENREWANARTEDGSLWVWIPRYAYKITYIDEENRSQGGTVEIMFLKGITNKNKDNIDITTLGYVIHPAFEDGNKTVYSNGEWEKELTGIWVAKFEAGLAGQIGTSSENMLIVETNLEYIDHFEEHAHTDGTIHSHTGSQEHTHNEYEEIEPMLLTYPVFIGKTYSYNWLDIEDAYKLARVLTAENNPYGLDEKEADSHMMKNSEWGAVAYLSYSKYGTDGEEILINNVSLKDENKPRVTAITGYGSLNEEENNIDEEIEMLPSELFEESYAWYTSIGELASTTRNRYGIFDMRGGLAEYISGYSNDIDHEDDTFFRDNRSNHLITIYANDKDEGTMVKNYEKNKDIYGEAVAETSKSGSGYTSWNEETSNYIDFRLSFFVRGGEYSRGKFSGIFSFGGHDGHPEDNVGFRAVIVKK